MEKREITSLKIINSTNETILLQKGELFEAEGPPFCDINNITFKCDLSDICIGAYGGYNLKDVVFQIKDIFFKVREHIQKIHISLFILKDMSLETTTSFTLWKQGFSLAIVTLSDKGFIGLRDDTSGPYIREKIKKHLPISTDIYLVLPDNYFYIKNILSDLVFNKKVDLIITTGGTGVTERDITPDATEDIIQKRLWGFEHAIMSEGLKKTKHAMISRGICGVANNSLIINLPGSKKAVLENLEAVLPAIQHTLEKIQNDPGECGT